MNWQHFQTFVWLRWRLFVNQLRKGGAVNAVFLVLIVACTALLATGLSVGFFVLGLLVLPRATPEVFLYVWDGLALAFLFCWTMGLMVQLQRAEVLSLDKFLHLPVSLRGAFLINYLSSLLSLSLAIFVPAVMAMMLGLVLGRGPAMLLLLPLLAGFVLMITALTYQFQGWLAALMVNQRRRRTIIVLVTMGVILVSQLPQMLHLLRPWAEQREEEITGQLQKEQQELQRALVAREITPEQHKLRMEGLQVEYNARLEEMENQALGTFRGIAWALSLAFPPGWLGVGAWAAAEGHILAYLLALMGMTLIGAASLWRSYVTTLRLYTGQFTKGTKAAAPVAPPPKSGKLKELLVERRLPWLSEQASAVALASFRSLLRAPEAKILLLTPVIMLMVFGSLFFANRVQLPDFARPLPALGMMGFILLCMIQLVGNQFGYDRGGFRVFVLSGAPRRDILLGKNLACAPLALGLAAVAVAFIAVVSPMRVDHLLALPPLMVSMYFLFCLVANVLSIFAPMAVRAGSFKPATPKMIPVLLQMLFGMFYPLAMVPALAALGTEIALAELAGIRGWPIALGLSLLVCAAALGLYGLILPFQGAWLQAREQKILETVTTKME